MSTENEEVYVDEEGNLIDPPKPEEPSAEGAENAAEETEAETSDDPLDTDDDAAESAESAAEDDETEEEREAIRERRRLERHERKRKQKEREESLRSELASRDAQLAQLREQVDAIARKNSGADLARLGEAKQQIVQAYNHFKEQIKVATEAADGATVAEATEKMMLARQRFEEIERAEKAYTAQQNTPAPLDPRIKDHAEKWMTKNKWYDPSGADEDSEVMLTIDNQMAKQGWNPTTPEYWEELSRRAQKYLPHRFQAQKREKPRSVVSGSGKESGGASSGVKGFRLSAERVQAIKDAGMWNEPAKRADMIKRFREFDKQNQK